MLASASDAYVRVDARRPACRTRPPATADEWRAALERYGPDDDARREAAQRGLQYVAEHHSEEQLLARWDRVFESILDASA